MLQLPDFKEKQIVFLQASKDLAGSIRFKNDNVAFYKDDKLVNQVSCHTLFAFFIQGDLTLTSVLIRKALDYGVSIVLMKDNLYPYAVIGAVGEGNYLLRHNQYHFVEDLVFAGNLVKNKCYNQLAILKEARADLFEESSKLQQFKVISSKIDGAADLNVLLGIEGSFAKQYFRNYFVGIDWYKRMPRTKTDVNNILLDIGYSILFNFVDSLLRLHGFDTYKGIYHQLFFQRKSLTCDLVEPFRFLIDKALLKAYHLGQIDKKDFGRSNGRYFLKYKESRKYMKIFLEMIMAHKEDIFGYVKKHYFCVLNNSTDFPFYKYK